MCALPCLYCSGDLVTVNIAIPASPPPPCVYVCVCVDVCVCVCVCVSVFAPEICLRGAHNEIHAGQ